MTTAFERDIEAFERELPSLLEEHSGQVALIRNAEVVGYFGTTDEAMSAGYERFQSGPFLVQEIHEGYGHQLQELCRS